MKTWFIWKDCTLSSTGWRNDPIDSFWIQASEKEAKQFFVNKLNTSELEEFENACINLDYLDRWYRGHREDNVLYEQDNDFRFLVSRDFSRITLGFAVYPYSSMWGRDDYPFERLEREISSPEDLKSIFLQSGSYCEKCNYFNQYLNKNNYICYSCKTGY